MCRSNFHHRPIVILLTCRSAATRKAYVRCLDHFMNYLKIDTYSKLLDKDPKIIHMDICDFISFMREDRSYAMVSLYVAATSLTETDLATKTLRILTITNANRGAPFVGGYL